MSGVTWHKDKLVAGRECGECQICCVVPSINKPDIQKLSGAPCRHSLQGSCDIYENRPDICRIFFCGWRRLAGIPDDWRPDVSGIFAVMEVNELPEYEFLAVALVLVGPPLKIIRRQDFLDFIIRTIRNNVALYLMLPGPKGMKASRILINNPMMLQAAARSPADVKKVLKLMLKELSEFAPTPHEMHHSGYDFST